MSATNFVDGVKSLVSSLINRRDAASQNAIVSQPLDSETLRQTYRNGIVNKIIRFKAGRSLKDTLQFESTDDENYYNARLAEQVKEAAKWMIAFGRGVIVLYHQDDDLVKPISRIDPERIKLKVFSGDMVTASGVDLDIMSPRYYKPLAYIIRGVSFHWSRVVDFTYVKPPELDAPRYQYGGISEIELIYDQIIADGIVQRASPKVIEKASTLFYKVRGFKDAMRTGKESEMVEYFSRMEDIRGIHSAGLVDQEDEIQEVSQTIANLADADKITLRRLAMVTGISVTALVGENAKGLNSSGENEAKMDQDMIEALQSEYLLEPINHLMRKCGQGPISFKENQGETAGDRIEYDTKAIDNAVKLASIGKDYETYLEDKDVIQKDDMAEFFTEVTGENVEELDIVDPASALNGAQVTAILEIIARIERGELSKITAVGVVSTAFPLSNHEATILLRDVTEGVVSGSA